MAEGFFNGGDFLPWTDSEMIVSCEMEAFFDGDNNESLIRLTWAVVHSYNKPDVHRGIALLEGQFARVGAPMHKRVQILYLMAVGQFRVGEYAKSQHFIDETLKILPNFQLASMLKKMVADKIVMEGLVGVGVVVAAVCVVAIGFATAVISASIRGRRR